MLCTVLLLFCSAFFQLERESQLYRSTQWINQLSEQITHGSPQEEPASIWFSTEENSEGLDQLRFLGVEAIELPLKDYEKLALAAKAQGLQLIGKAFLQVSDESADFKLALASYKEYPHLFHLIELNREDWSSFPEGILPTPEVQLLKKKGYLPGNPEKIYPYSAVSSWKASPPVRGEDGKERRWIYQFTKEGPSFNWIDPTFLSRKLAGGEITHALLVRSQSILLFPSMEQEAFSSLALLTKKLGGRSALRIQAPLKKIQGIKTDFLYDPFTPSAILHALITENAEALRLIYKAFLAQKINLRSFIHEIPAASLCEWSAFLQSPKSYRYPQETETAELLVERILNNDLLVLVRTPTAQTPLFGLCPDVPKFREKRELLKQAHSLLAFFSLMQPGIFSFSSRDLNGQGLYPSLTAQLHNKNSFALQLKNLLSIRSKIHLQQATLIDVISTKNRSLLVLVYQLPDNLLALIALNVARAPLQEELHSPHFANKWAIDLQKGLTEKKIFNEPILNLQLDALSGKLLLLQPKYAR